MSFKIIKILGLQQIFFIVFSHSRAY